jgi:hypothetical protein
MSIRSREDALFEQWKMGRKGFVADGVVDEKAYLASSTKILFVLKEVNDPGGGGWDLREFLAKGGRPKTWRNVTRWLIGLRRLDEDLDWSELESISEEQRVAELRSICAINVKKAPGGHTSDPGAVAAAGEQDERFLKEQLALYDADLTIACGSVVGNIVGALLGISTWEMTRRGISFAKMPNNKVVISYAHPEARVQDSLLYYGLVDATRELVGSRP